MAGIAETDTIDLIAQDAEGRVLLVMVEERPWGVGNAQDTQLREKINTYAGYVLEGGLEREYPDTVGQPVLIQLNCTEPPHGEVATTLDFAIDQLKGLGIGFRVNITS